MFNLVVGGDSQIGLALSDFWRENNIPFHASTRHKGTVSNNCPLIDLNNVETFKNLKYKSAIICAAITDIAECENNPNKTRKVNVEGTIKLVNQFSKKGIHIVFLSSNQVFDGEHPFQNSNAARNPITEYGRQKAETEIIIERLPHTCVLRLTKVIHPDLPILKNWEEKLSIGEKIYAFSDMTLSPISIEDVVTKIDNLVRNRSEGIFQLSGNFDISYYEFAQKFTKEHGFPKKLVIKNSWKNILTYAPPKFNSLVNV